MVNILLLQNEKQYSIRSCFTGFQTFCFISLVLFAHKVSLLYLFCVSIHLWMSERSLAAISGSSKDREPGVLSATSLFWLPQYLYCLFINWSTLLSDLQSRLDGSDPIGRGLLWSALLSCHLCTQKYSMKWAFFTTFRLFMCSFLAWIIKWIIGQPISHCNMGLMLHVLCLLYFLLYLS